MQDLLLLLTAVMFLSIGLVAPFVLSLGYVWVDVFDPQHVSSYLLTTLPISLVMGGGAFAAYLAMDRRMPPKIGAIAVLMILLGVWVTCTLQWAVAPDLASYRWNITIKTVLFAIFLPFVIRSRIQIEAFVLVYVFSIMGHLIAWGLKTVLTGGGYNQSLGLLNVNSGLLAESSSVSAIAVMMAPFLLSIRKWSVILPRGRLMTLGIWGLVALSLVASVGTFARTALIAVGVTGTAMWVRSKNKMMFLLVALGLGGLMYAVTSDRWASRISTVTDYQNEGSAFVRILVWQWTIGFSATHPLGGGFWAYVVNRIEVPMADSAQPLILYGRAYHNIFFALLGDHGYPGLLLYLCLLATVLLSLQRTRNRMRVFEEHAWAADLAQTIQVSILTLMAAGMFVEIGWHPVVWYLYSMAVCLQQYARRVLSGETQPLSRAIRVVQDPVAAIPANAAVYPGGSRPLKLRQ